MRKEGCVFCKIVAGEITSTKIYEDADFVAFLDIHPLSSGHTLVIPKDHYRFVWDMPNEVLCACFDVVQKIAHSMQKSFGTDEIHEKVVGDEVHHAHVWVYPNPTKAIGDRKDFVANGEKIRTNL